MELSNPSMLNHLIQLVNQVYEMEKKLARMENSSSLMRNLRRMKQELDQIGLSYHDPVGEPYDETRTDCDASISGVGDEDLVIQEVIKPIIREGGKFGQIIQRGIVVVAAN
ncbi:MAG: hypothetical protein AAF587_17580 [Bacteroidota bacterium]